jgi:hypothetical protein
LATDTRCPVATLRGSCGECDKVGNLKRGGRLERVKPTSSSEHPVEHRVRWPSGQWIGPPLGGGSGCWRATGRTNDLRVDGSVQRTKSGFCGRCAASSFEDLRVIEQARLALGLRFVVDGHGPFWKAREGRSCEGRATCSRGKSLKRRKPRRASGRTSSNPRRAATDSRQDQCPVVGFPDSCCCPNNAGVRSHTRAELLPRSSSQRHLLRTIRSSPARWPAAPPAAGWSFGAGRQLAPLRS